MRVLRLLVAASLLAVLPFAGAQAVPVTHNVAVAAGETATWNGTARPGANVNYNGLVDEGTQRQCSTDVQTMCEYALVAATNPVPADDADGKLRKNMTITLDTFTLPSPASDFDVVVYASDATGSVKGPIMGESANTDVVDPDEQVVFSVTTTTAAPTQYFLVEVAYFTSLNAGYKGTVRF